MGRLIWLFIRDPFSVKFEIFFQENDIFSHGNFSFLYYNPERVKMLRIAIWKSDEFYGNKNMKIKKKCYHAIFVILQIEKYLVIEEV